ncbi:MAG: hypothetical protein QF415_11660 [Candidatus Undinarchaeales archaeon]|jgi:hypothetical protein|nr:hypothetical protein [Candidatus Undinarchaeales archaeon]MDP7491524.1 hypothetical protein [Candidatus Undinarchaeales archaeon]
MGWRGPAGDWVPDTLSPINGDEAAEVIMSLHPTKEGRVNAQKAGGRRGRRGQHAAPGGTNEGSTMEKVMTEMTRARPWGAHRYIIRTLGIYPIDSGATNISVSDNGYLTTWFNDMRNADVYERVVGKGSEFIDPEGKLAEDLDVLHNAGIAEKEVRYRTLDKPYKNLLGEIKEQQSKLSGLEGDKEEIAQTAEYLASQQEWEKLSAERKANQEELDSRIETINEMRTELQSVVYDRNKAEKVLAARDQMLDAGGSVSFLGRGKEYVKILEEESALEKTSFGGRNLDEQSVHRYERMLDNAKGRQDMLKGEIASKEEKAQPYSLTIHDETARMEELNVTIKAYEEKLKGVEGKLSDEMIQLRGLQNAASVYRDTLQDIGNDGISPRSDGFKVLDQYGLVEPSRTAYNLDPQQSPGAKRIEALKQIESWNGGSTNGLSLIGEEYFNLNKGTWQNPSGIEHVYVWALCKGGDWYYHETDYGHNMWSNPGQVLAYKVVVDGKDVDPADLDGMAEKLYDIAHRIGRHENDVDRYASQHSGHRGDMKFL